MKVEEQLFMAASQGNYELLQILIGAGVDINIWNENGLTPLMIATMYGHLPCVKMLTANGAFLDVECKRVNRYSSDDSEYHGMTPLLIAAYQGHVECLEHLRDAKASMDVCSNDRLYPLAVAADRGHLACVIALIKGGADVNQVHRCRSGYQGSYSSPYTYGRSALESASLNGHYDCVDLLLKAGADIQGSKALLHAAENGHDDCVQRLISAGVELKTGICIHRRTPIIQHENIERHTALTLAALGGHIKCVEKLVIACVGTNAQSVEKELEGETTSIPALICAVAGGSVECVEKMVALGANLHKRLVYSYDAGGWLSGDFELVSVSALDLAYSKGNVDMFKALIRLGFEIGPEHAYMSVDIRFLDALIDAGFDVNSDNGKALTDAVRRRDLTSVEKLLAAGAKPENAWVEAFSSIPYEVKQRIKETGVDDNAKIIELLVAAGVDINAIHIEENQEKTALSMAADLGDIQLIELLLRLGASVQGFSGVRAIKCAIERDSRELFEKLIAAGVDVSAQDNNGETVLRHALRAGRSDYVKRMEDVGLVIEYSDAILRDASYGGSLEYIEKAIASGADVNNQDSKGYNFPPLMLAINHPECVKRLIAAGANVDLAIYDDTPLRCAVKVGCVESLEHLMAAGADINAKSQGPSNATPLMLAVIDCGAEQDNYLMCIRKLIAGGANVNDSMVERRTGLEKTILMSAVERNYPNIVEILLDSGADPDLVMTDDSRRALPEYTALLIAVEGNYAEVVEKLLAGGADPNKRLNGGRTALMVAAEKGHVQTLKKMIAGGVNVNLRDDQGMSAFAYAFGYRGECLELLIAAGADVNARDANGMTALIWAAEQSKPELLRKLIVAGASTLNATIIGDKDERHRCDGDTALITAARKGCKVCVRILIDAGADVNLKNKDGKTALMFAAEEGNDCCLKLLIEARANIDVISQYGWYSYPWRKYGGRCYCRTRKAMSALMYAARSGNVDMLEALISAGADVNAAEVVGTHIPNEDSDVESENEDALPRRKTALMYAAKNGNEACVEKLIASGAELDIQDIDGNTALLVAVERRHPGCVARLVSAGADTKIENAGGMTALALSEGDIDCTKILETQPGVSLVSYFTEQVSVPGCMEVLSNVGVSLGLREGKA